MGTWHDLWVQLILPKSVDSSKQLCSYVAIIIELATSLNLWSKTFHYEKKLQSSCMSLRVHSEPSYISYIVVL